MSCEAGRGRGVRVHIDGNLSISYADVWLEWLEDEKRQAEDRDEKEEVIGLFALAMQDYRCTSSRCVCGK